MKVLYVSSQVQADLMSKVFIPELIDGFWKNHRPAGHGEVWRDVQVKVTEDGTLGPVGFTPPRNYNFLNLEFAVPNEERLVLAAQEAKPNATFKYIKKELIELGRIVGGRLAARDAAPVKLYRGNHRPGTETVSSAKARKAGAALVNAATQPVEIVEAKVEDKPKQTVKKTVTKSTGASTGTVRRIPAETMESASTEATLGTAES